MQIFAQCTGTMLGIMSGGNYQVVMPTNITFEEESTETAVNTRGTAVFLFGLYLDKKPAAKRCIGYPNCGGDLTGEPHSKECPLYSEPAAEDKK